MALQYGGLDPWPIVAVFPLPDHFLGRSCPSLVKTRLFCIMQYCGSTVESPVRAVPVISAHVLPFHCFTLRGDIRVTVVAPAWRIRGMNPRMGVSVSAVEKPFHLAKPFIPMIRPVSTSTPSREPVHGLNGPGIYSLFSPRKPLIN